MPWPQVDPVDFRLMVAQAYAAGASMTSLCEQYGISRKTGYKWVQRYEAEGLLGLADRSRRPHVMPTATDPAVLRALCAARCAHPTWSAHKLLVVLRAADPARPWPARSTGCALLKQQGLVRARRRAPRPWAGGSPLGAITRPNDVWTTDFKGDFRTGDGARCYPFTLRDGFSRYTLRCDALPRKSSSDTRVCFERAFAEYGLPDRIRSDNGGPFAAAGLTRLSYLAVWWIRLGIIPERITPGHPEQNASHEQFHRVLKAETARPPAATCRAQQQRFVRFQREYNEHRPHAALNDRVPASCYAPSPRPLPPRPPAVEYPGHFEVRRVDPHGTISWRGRSLHVAGALSDQRVGLEEVDEGIWILWFAQMRLARFDERTRQLRPLRGDSQ